MKQTQFFCAGLLGQIERIGVNGMSPIDEGFVFLLGVFSIMDQEICTADKFEIIIESQPSWMNMSQFVVGQKYEALAVFNKFIATAAVWMTQRNRHHADRADFKRRRKCNRIG